MDDRDALLSEVRAGITAKVQRAARLIEELQQIDLTYLMSEPVEHLVEADPTDHRYVVTVKVIRQPPVELALVFGDALHNLRASLDYMARGLVIANGGDPIDRGGARSTAFPIRKVRPEQPISIFPGISPAARDQLEAVQPFSSDDPARHPLAILDELENRDKHRLLNVGRLSGSVGAVFIPSDLDPPSRSADDPTHHITVWSDEPQIVQVDPAEFIPSPRLVGMWSWATVLAEHGPSWHGQVTGYALKIAETVGETLDSLGHHLRPGDGV